mmetsp:Transcript_42851/g.108405  ORF Transcript_42851/g.108405 Transcript_42851/m.108405 type:complete len:358 (-) Transcript_42851:302-1375(-)
MLLCHLSWLATDSGRLCLPCTQRRERSHSCGGRLADGLRRRGLGIQDLLRGEDVRSEPLEVHAAQIALVEVAGGEARDLALQGAEADIVAPHLRVEARGGQDVLLVRRPRHRGDRPHVRARRQHAAHERVVRAKRVLGVRQQRVQHQGLLCGALGQLFLGLGPLALLLLLQARHRHEPHLDLAIKAARGQPLPRRAPLHRHHLLQVAPHLHARHVALRRHAVHQHRAVVRRSGEAQSAVCHLWPKLRVEDGRPAVRGDHLTREHRAAVGREAKDGHRAVPAGRHKHGAVRRPVDVPHVVAMPRVKGQHGLRLAVTGRQPHVHGAVRRGGREAATRVRRPREARDAAAVAAQINQRVA